MKPGRAGRKIHYGGCNWQVPVQRPSPQLPARAMRMSIGLQARGTAPSRPWAERSTDIRIECSAAVLSVRPQPQRPEIGISRANIRPGRPGRRNQRTLALNVLLISVCAAFSESVDAEEEPYMSRSVKAKVRRSFITTAVREQPPRSHHKGATGRVRTGDQRCAIANLYWLLARRQKIGGPLSRGGH